MNKHTHHRTRYSGSNVTPMPIKTPENLNSAIAFPGAGPSPGAIAAAGSSDDPRMKEALRLIEAFLAIEDPAARESLVTLAESLVSYDWLRKAKER